MPNADGSVIIKTDLDNSQLEKKYGQLIKKIESAEKELYKTDDKRNTAAFNLGEAKKAADTAKKSISEMKMQLEEAQKAMDPQSAKGFNIPLDQFMEYQERLRTLPGKIKEQEAEAAKLAKKVEELTPKAEAFSNKCNDAKVEIEHLKEEAAELNAKIEENSKSAREMGVSFDGVKKRVEKVGNRIAKLAASALVFSAITKGLTMFRDYMGDVISTNDEASAALARLKGALLTMIQPLVSVIIPAFTTFVNILTAVIGKIASFIAMLGGTTAEEASGAAKALNAETKALNSTGTAAKKASQSLAGFDEINRLDSADASGGGGGSATSTDPDFSWADGVAEDLSRIADLILLIGAGLALWKIGGMLPGVLGTIATTLGGILVTIGGLLLMWDGMTDAWENGVDWENLIEMIVGLTAAAGGLYIAFGPVAAGIMLIVGGLALLVTGFHDAMESGFNLENTLLTIAGIIATGLGITLLTGSLIPLLVAAIAGLLLALTVATGHGGELIEGVQKICQGFVDFITGIFSGDIEMALGGIETMFDGLGEAIGAVISGVRDTILSFLDWLDEKTGGKLSGIIGVVKELVTGLFDGISETVTNTVDGIRQVFSGLVEFVSGVLTGDWDRAWEGIKDIFKGVWNANISTLEGAANLIIDGLNWVLKKINGISIKIPDWVPGVGGSYFGPSISLLDRVELPRLAQGAVIPPNREFLAVLGDQKRGTNIEAPLSTIQEAVAIVMEDMTNGMMAGFEATVGVLQEILEAVYGIEIGDEVIAKAVQRYQSKMAVVKGGN